MAFTLKQHAKGRNVEPISSVLHVQTLDGDCSALAAAPIDGELVDFNGQGRAVADNGSGVSLLSPAKMKMVWAHKDQSDIQATGRKRVPVIFKGDLHCRLKLFQAGDGQNSNTAPAAGDWLVCKAVGGAGADKDRMVAHSIKTAELSVGDCLVGYVLTVISADELECVLYSQSRIAGTVA
jgi:hypothetical protein